MIMNYRVPLPAGRGRRQNMRHAIKGACNIGYRSIIGEDERLNTFGLQLLGLISAPRGSGYFPTFCLKRAGDKAGGKSQSETEQLIGHQGTFYDGKLV